LAAKKSTKYSRRKRVKSPRSVSRLEMNGYGLITWPSGNMYQGGMKHGRKNGFGTLIRKCPKTKSVMVYTGSWKNNQRHGLGQQLFKNGNVYQGHYKNNKRSDGFGIYFWRGDENDPENLEFGNIYQGEFRGKLRHGNGTMYWHKSREIYRDGIWVDDEVKSPMEFWFCAECVGLSNTINSDLDFRKNRPKYKKIITSNNQRPENRLIMKKNGEFLYEKTSVDDLQIGEVNKTGSGEGTVWPTLTSDTVSDVLVDPNSDFKQISSISKDNEIQSRLSTQAIKDYEIPFTNLAPGMITTDSEKWLKYQTVTWIAFNCTSKWEDCKQLG